MRKNTFRTVVAAVLICALLVIPAFAESAVVTGSGVNVRSGPGTNYKTIDCLAKGTVVTVTDRSNADWYAISYNGITGFMSSRYLSITDDNASSGSTVTGTTAYINAMYVCFRSGPGTGYSKLGMYNTGKEVTVTGTSGDWTACVINGQSGYVFSQYISYYNTNSGADYEGEGPDFSAGVIVPSEEPSQAPSTPPSADPAVPSEEPGSASGNVVVGGSVAPSPTPAPTPTPTPTPTPAPPSAAPGTSQTGYINGNEVNFRTGPGTNYRIIGCYNKGKELTITGTYGDWTACVIDGQSGYVFSQYVTLNNPNAPAPSTPSTPSTSEPGYITGNNVRLRSGPSTSAGILGELFYGNVVTITGTSGDWTQVIYNGQAGYVYSQYVAKGTYTPPTSSGGTATGREIADYALQFVGYNYTWGGASPSTGFDCSGLMYYVYKQFGYTLNRVAADQALNGVHVEPSDLQPGDLLCFYSGGSYIGHVGMYIGNNMFVHAANSATGVITSELSGYYATRGFEARRII